MSYLPGPAGPPPIASDPILHPLLAAPMGTKPSSTTGPSAPSHPIPLRQLTPSQAAEQAASAGRVQAAQGKGLIPLLIIHELHVVGFLGSCAERQH